MELRTELRATCNWTVDWYANRSDAANKERTIILKNVRHFLWLNISVWSRELSKRKYKHIGKDQKELPVFFFLLQKGKSMGWTYVCIESSGSIDSESFYWTIDKSVEIELNFFIQNESNTCDVTFLESVIVYRCFLVLWLCSYRLWVRHEKKKNEEVLSVWTVYFVY